MLNIPVMMTIGLGVTCWVITFLEDVENVEKTGNWPEVRELSGKSLSEKTVYS